MKVLLAIPLLGILLASCASSGTAFMRPAAPVDGRAGYQLAIPEFHGVNVSSRQAWQLLANAFMRNGIKITSDSPNVITCSCELGVVTRDFILVMETAHHAKIDCTIVKGADKLSFSADGAATYYSRIFLTLGLVAGAFAPPEIGIPAMAVGAGADVIGALTRDQLGQYQTALQEAVKVGAK